MRAISVVVAITAVMAGAPSGEAQPRRPSVELTPIVESAPVRAGSTVRLSLKVRLPRNIHVQANKPRDPSLIPTVLTVETPAGVTVEEIRYPPGTELAQTGRSEKLVVLGPEFAIAVRLVLATAVAPGELLVPGLLRYQACNDTVCFPPARARVQWVLAVERGTSAS